MEQLTTDPQPEPQPEPHTEPIQTKLEPHTEPIKSKPEPHPEPQPEPIKTESEPQPEPKPEPIKTELEPPREPQPEPIKTKSEPQPERIERKPEPQPEPKPERIETKPEPSTVTDELTRAKEIRHSLERKIIEAQLQNALSRNLLQQRIDGLMPNSYSSPTGCNLICFTACVILLYQSCFTCIMSNGSSLLIST